MLLTQVQITNNSASELNPNCNLFFSGGPGGSGGIGYAVPFLHVPAGRRGSVTFLGHADVLSGTPTITGSCGSLPAGVIANFHMTAIQVATLHQ